MTQKIDIFYRWMDIPKFDWSKIWEVKLAFIWRLVALKWVDNLIECFQVLSSDSLELIIIWDWEERDKLKQKAESSKSWGKITFLWEKDHDFVLDFLQKNKVVLVNPSFQEWLPTIVIEWLLTWNVVVASNVWGTREISDEKDLVLFEAGDKEDLGEKLKYALENFEDLDWLSRESVERKFSWEESIGRLYNLVK
jgi:glycosyltransferase involved in cell wall biosynthesis